MKKITLLAGLALLFFAACQDSSFDSNPAKYDTGASLDHSIGGLKLLVASNPAWSYKNLRLYPVVADAGSFQTQNALPAVKSLAEAINIQGFRITERKRFGRSPDAWYNALTVQNKSQDTIFLMAGDVVRGGNQDRVIAYDDIVLPATVKNILVFCVEAGRSSYYDPEAPMSEKKLAAFHGYYNVASPQVRKAVYSGNQSGVWDAVASVTAANKAESSTRAYAALETENDLKAKRTEYLRFFDGKFAQEQQVVGVVAVCGSTVLGVDIFGRPDLFRQQFNGLMHGYATEAAVSKDTALAATADELARNAFRSVARLADQHQNGNDQAGKFSLNDTWLHLYRK